MESVKIYLRAGEEKRYITSLEHEMFVKGITLSRTGDTQRLVIANQSSGVELEIPRTWVPDLIVNMVMMLEPEDAYSILRDLENAFVR